MWSKSNIVLTIIVLIEVLVIIHLTSKIFNLKVTPAGKIVQPIVITDFNEGHCDVTRRPASDESLYVELISSLTVICKRNGKEIEIKINSMGFRDHEFNLEKASNEIRILAIGDSHTYGWGVSLEDTWPKQLEKLLKAEVNNKTNKTINVLNLGIPGLDIWNEANLLVKKGVKLSPDMVLIGFIENDVVPESKVCYNGACHIDKYINYVYNYTWREEYLGRSFSLIRSVYNGTIVIILWPLPSDYEKQLKTLAKKHDIMICETKDVYEKHKIRDLILSDEDQHPNELAYSEIAKKVKNCIQDLLISKTLR